MLVILGLSSARVYAAVFFSYNTSSVFLSCLFVGGARVEVVSRDR